MGASVVINPTNISDRSGCSSAKGKLPFAEFAALWVRYTSRINGTRCRLESGFDRVRLLRLTTQSQFSWQSHPLTRNVVPSGSLMITSSFGPMFEGRSIANIGSSAR